MGYSKYSEDIEDRLLEDTAGRYESRVSELLDIFPPRVTHAGDVYLTRNGRRMEDFEVCEMGYTLDLAVISTLGTDEPLIEFGQDSERRELRISSSGRIKVLFTKTGTHCLQVSSGGYVKPYSIQVVDPFEIEQLPDFAKLLQSLADNPTQWTEKTFEQFRIQLEDILGKAAVPELFVRGIIEYYLGLFQEEQRLPAFRERFQTAYGCLRWFIPYSDIAKLICAYYLYCSNEFEAASKLCSELGSRLANAILFYSQKSTAWTPTVKTKKRTKAGLPLLLAMADVLTFEAIEAIDDDRVNDATELAAVIRRQTIPAFDRERAERLRMLEACTIEQSGDIKTARLLFETLQESPWQAIASAASSHLK
jgi:hypothetical protein